MDLGFYSTKHMESVDFIGSVVFKPKHMFKVFLGVSKQGPWEEGFLTFPAWEGKRHQALCLKKSKHFICYTSLA